MLVHKLMFRKQLNHESQIIMNTCWVMMKWLNHAISLHISSYHELFIIVNYCIQQEYSLFKNARHLANNDTYTSPNFA